MKKKVHVAAFYGAAVLIAVLLVVYLLFSNNYPKGSDVFGHIYKADYLYHAILNGEWNPIYSPDWYNGVELFRYWPPFAYYILALLQFVTGGDVMMASIVFIGFCYLISTSGWLLFGLREKKYWLPFLVANLYYFSPDNLRIVFSEGNIPLMFVATCMPLLMYFVWEFLQYKNVKALIGVSVMAAVFTATHLTMALITTAAIVIYSIIYGIVHKIYQYPGLLIVNWVLTQIAMGILWVKSASGDIIEQTTASSVESVREMAQEAVLSLNPVLRYESLEQFYFGLAIFCIALLGLITATKDTFSGFFSTLLVFLGTTTVVNSLIKVLPFSHIYWMHRFVPIGMCLFFIAFLHWRKLKTSWLVIFCIAMVLDITPTLRFLYYDDIKAGESVEAQMEKDMGEKLVREAKEMTVNRMAIMDLSDWGSYPSYYLCGQDEEDVLYTFGRSYQGAATLSNVVSVNEAFENGFYPFVFDRLLQMGNDTIVIPKEQLDEEHIQAVKVAAGKLGYSNVGENENAILFHLAVSGTFGTITEYESLAIGEDAECICYMYPQFGYADRTNLSDFTYNELKKYKSLYLSGFTYDNKDETEALLEKLAQSGTRVFIDMQHVPMNKLNGKVEFMGVYAQPITFTERFPILETDDGSQFKLNVSTPGYDVWNTIYLSSVQDNLKTAEYDNKADLTYLGTNGNDNIVFIGFNTVYYYTVTRDRDLLPFLNEVFDETENKLPNRKVVPISVDYQYNQVVVETEYDNVNTNLANLDCFDSLRDEQSENNMVVVDHGKTILKVKESTKVAGILISLLGISLLLVFWKKIIFDNRA